MSDIDAILSSAMDHLKNNRPMDALQLVNQSISQNQLEPKLWALKGQVHHFCLQINRARNSYQKALELNPSQFNALAGLGELTHGTVEQELSLKLLDRALTIDPNSTVPLMLSVAGRLLSSNQRDRIECIRRIKRFLRQKPQLHYLVKAAYWVPFLDVDRELEEDIFEAIRQKFPDANEKVCPAENLVNRGHERIHVGYVSPNLGDHAIGHITNRLFENHDRDRFEVQLYSTGRENEKSEYKKHIEKTSDRYISLEGKSVLQARDVILSNEVDILIDLNGYMGSTQIIEIFSHRPAPVQIYWLGHGGSLGLPFYDYIIGDPVVTPEDEDDRYVESVVRLPEFFAPADPHKIYEGKLNRSDFSLNDDCIVFCAFNNPAKIDSAAMNVWMRILREVPDSQLWLTQGSNPLATQNLKTFAVEQGVDPERLIFAGRIPDKSQHFARIKLADLFLDTFTVNAATTAIDTIWAGVPVLTCPGGHYCSRISAGVVRAVGQEHMICHSADEYVDRAIHLARHPEELSRIRLELVNQLPQSILFDPPRFTRELETAYIQMWELAQSGKMSESFSV